MKLMTDLDLAGLQGTDPRGPQRADLRDGVITNDARLRAAAPSIMAALDQGAAVIVMSHLGRPVEGEWSEAASLSACSPRASPSLLGRDVLLATDSGATSRRFPATSYCSWKMFGFNLG